MTSIKVQTPPQFSRPPSRPLSVRSVRPKTLLSKIHTSTLGEPKTVTTITTFRVKPSRPETPQPSAWTPTQVFSCIDPVFGPVPFKRKKFLKLSDLAMYSTQKPKRQVEQASEKKGKPSLILGETSFRRFYEHKFLQGKIYEKLTKEKALKT